MTPIILSTCFTGFNELYSTQTVTFQISYKVEISNISPTATYSLSSFDRPRFLLHALPLSPRTNNGKGSCSHFNVSGQVRHCLRGKQLLQRRSCKGIDEEFIRSQGFSRNMNSPSSICNNSRIQYLKGFSCGYTSGTRTISTL